MQQLISVLQGDLAVCGLRRTRPCQTKFESSRQALAATSAPQYLATFVSCNACKCVPELAPRRYDLLIETADTPSSAKAHFIALFQ
jgi:hypothetical protein